ncbi:uncharacterized protein MONBRDRAFT_2871, partial [Monosiga brevicollis MX1]
VAIKKFTRPFQDREFALRTLREMRILRHLRGGPENHVVQFLGAYTPDASLDLLEQVYVVIEALDFDLRKILNSRRLSEDLIRHIMVQVAQGLEYMHSANVLHRDLKPENIACNSDTSVRIIDMGLCRTQRQAKDTPYVQTRFYRAPEIVCLCEYDRPADWWSFGAILAECM